VAGQLELFDSPLQGNVKGERHIMEFPFFDLSKRARRKRLIFSDQERGVTIEIKAIEGSGIATIYDKDMILYVASLIAQDLAKGGKFRREYRFSAHDFFRVAGRDRSKRSYANLEQTIERLKGTLIKTNIETGGQGFDGWFNWFDSGTALHYERDSVTGEKRLKMIRVVLCEWLFRAILNDGKMLEYCDEYFDLKPIERRLYDLARIHCDDAPLWTIELGPLKDLVGSDSEISKFRAQVAAISKAGRLPDHEISLIDRQGGLLSSRALSLARVKVVFSRKNRELDADAEDTSQTVPVAASRLSEAVEAMDDREGAVRPDDPARSDTASCSEENTRAGAQSLARSALQ
jgi:plasmid replication initiation protein